MASQNRSIPVPNSRVSCRFQVHQSDAGGPCRVDQSAWQARGPGFESPMLHRQNKLKFGPLPARGGRCAPGAAIGFESDPERHSRALVNLLAKRRASRSHTSSRDVSGGVQSHARHAAGPGPRGAVPIVALADASVPFAYQMSSFDTDMPITGRSIDLPRGTTFPAVAHVANPADFSTHADLVHARQLRACGRNSSPITDTGPASMRTTRLQSSRCYSLSRRDWEQSFDWCARCTRRTWGMILSCQHCSRLPGFLESARGGPLGPIWRTVGQASRRRAWM
jgi:hypothetical protein